MTIIFPSSPPAHDVNLIAAAKAAQSFAMPDITGFKVGAAVRAADGSIFSGSNAEVVVGHIEHAERAALSAGRQAGHRAFVAAAVVAAGPSIVTPCGSCRDWLNRHLSADAPVHCYNIQNGKQARYTIAELLPHAPRLEELTHDVRLLTDLRSETEIPCKTDKKSNLTLD